MADRRVHITFSGHVPMEQQPAQWDTEWPVKEKQEDTAGCITPSFFCPPLFMCRGRQWLVQRAQSSCCCKQNSFQRMNSCHLVNSTWMVFIFRRNKDWTSNLEYPGYKWNVSSSEIFYRSSIGNQVWQSFRGQALNLNQPSSLLGCVQTRQSLMVLN